MGRVVRRRIQFLLLAGAGALSVATASAADLGVTPAIAPASADPWNGLYFGAGFGAGFGDARTAVADRLAGEQVTTNPPGSVVSDGAGSASLNGRVTGSVADLFAGYNMRWGGPLVVGGQIEGTAFSDITTNTSGSYRSTQTDTIVSDGVSTLRTVNNTVSFDHVEKLRSMFSAVGRAGLLLPDRTLLYLLGGGVLGHFTMPDASGIFGDNPIGRARDTWVLGYTAGAGVEHRITPNWSLRTEYRYIHFDIDRDQSRISSQQAASPDAGATSTAGGFSRTRSTAFDLHLAKLGLVYAPWATDTRSGAYAAVRPTKATASLLGGGDPWTGIYWGASFGAGTGRSRTALRQSETGASESIDSGIPSSESFSSNGAGSISGRVTGSVVDLFTGYNLRWGGPFVIGGQIEGTVFSDVVLDASGTTTSQSTRVSSGFPTLTTSTTTFDNTDKLRSMVSAVGRAGWLPTDRTLLYLLGGGVLGHFTLPETTDILTTGNKWALGYTVGAGAEHRITPNWSLRAEYRYVHFDIDRQQSFELAQSFVDGTTASATTDLINRNRTTAFDFHLGKLGIVYTPWATDPAAGAYAATLPAKSMTRLLANSDPWSGVYVGISFGAGAGGARTGYASDFSDTFMNAPQTSITTDRGSGNLDGRATGSVVDLFAGYSMRWGSYVAGAQLEGTLFSDVALKTSGFLETRNTQTADGEVLGASTRAQTVDHVDELRSMVSAVGRAGWLPTDQTLVYLLGGGVLGHFVVPDVDRLGGGESGKWALGYTAGAGIEHRFLPRWSLRAEYRYVHFDIDRDQSSISANARTNSPPLGVTDITTKAQRTAFDFHLAKLGIVYTPGAVDAPAGMLLPVKAARRMLASTDPWNGVYFGASVGSGGGDARTHLTESSTDISLTDSGASGGASSSIGSGHLDGRITGSMVDLFAGYNVRSGGSYVVGGQIEGTVFSSIAANTTGLSASSQTVTTITDGVGTVTSTADFSRPQDRTEELRSMVSAVGRAGWLPANDTLLYLLGGAVLGHFVDPATTPLYGIDSLGKDRNKWILGYTAGAGVEHRFARNWSVRAEYRYLHFDIDRHQAHSDSTTGVTFPFTSTGSFVHEESTAFNLHLAKFGIVYTPTAH